MSGFAGFLEEFERRIAANRTARAAAAAEDGLFYEPDARRYNDEFVMPELAALPADREVVVRTESDEYVVLTAAALMAVIEGRACHYRLAYESVSAIFLVSTDFTVWARSFETEMFARLEGVISQIESAKDRLERGTGKRPLDTDTIWYVSDYHDACREADWTRSTYGDLRRRAEACYWSALRFLSADSGSFSIVHCGHVRPSVLQRQAEAAMFHSCDLLYVEQAFLERARERRARSSKTGRCRRVTPPHRDFDF
ncbi:TPA: hypothetical protein DF272_06710 [Candidatus Falkowbacteria bacterium]|nr:hypothetical protein [Candidatus Falkowbacteria bacterium]